MEFWMLLCKRKNDLKGCCWLVSAVVTKLLLGGDILLGNVNTSPKSSSKDLESTNGVGCNTGTGQESCAMDVNGRGGNVIELVCKKHFNLVVSD